MALALTGIKTEIVAQAIGLASGNVGELCLGRFTTEPETSNRINKWSKYKPVKFNSVAPDRSGTWWRSTDGNCGLNIPNYSTMDMMFTALRGAGVTWNYLTPAGGASQPFRISDFGGYEHAAQPPLVPMILNSKYYASFGKIGTALSLRVQSAYELTISDIGITHNLGSMYFGVAICKKNTAGYKYMTENANIVANGGGHIDIPISSELGTYEVVYFLAKNVKSSFSAPDIVNTFIPVPNAMQLVTIEQSSISVSVKGTFALQTANYTITIYNTYGAPVAINGCSITFRYKDKAPSDDLVMGEKIKSLGDVVVPADSSITLTGTISAVGAEFASKGGYLYFKNGTDISYNKRGEFIQ